MQSVQSYVPSSSPLLAVVHPQYCLPFETHLTVIKQPYSFSGGDFVIHDAHGRLAFQVDGVACSRRSRRVLLDSTGNALLCAECKLMSLHSGWVVYRGDRSQKAEKLFTVQISSYFQFKTSLDVFLASNKTQQEPDFRVKGQFLKRNYTVFHGNQNIAEVKSKITAGTVLLGKDTFVVTVLPGIDQAFIAMLIVIMDEIENGGNG